MRRRPSLRSSPALVLAFALACGGSEVTTEEPTTATGTGGETELTFGNPVSEDLRVGGQPTEADLEAAAANGYTTVISLRTEGEPGTEGEAATVERLGMTHVSIPVAGAEDLTVEKAEALDAALDSASGPVLLHCGSGNRAGSLLGLRAYVTEGATGDEAMTLAEGAGMTGLADALEAKLTELCEGEPARCPGGAVDETAPGAPAEPLEGPVDEAE
jgi:uncharacterized protein (TIGR01244 family)